MTTYAGHYGPEPFQDLKGNAFTAVAAKVYDANGTDPAVLWADRERSAGLSNPLPVGVPAGDPGIDLEGNGTFWAEPGRYVLEVRTLDDPSVEVWRGPISIDPDPDEVTDQLPRSARHDEGAPSTLWSFPHNLGYFPAIYCEDSAGTTQEPGIHHVNVNLTELSFASPTQGFATAT